MNLPPLTIIEILVGCAAYLAALYFIDERLVGKTQVGFRFVAIVASVSIFFFGLGRLIDDHERRVDVTKAMLAIGAAACVFYEQHRIGLRRPVAERWKRFVGVIIGLAAIITYFNGFKFGYAKYYHRWDQYHYYMGAKYFREMGYDGLYKCTAIAEDDLGVVNYIDEDTEKPARIDMRAEVRAPTRKIRNLGGDNLLMPVADALEHPEVCKARFSPERWEAYKADVKFFRTASDKQYWEDMQGDHGFNPPPAWTIVGHFVSNLHPASTAYLQFLASLDIFYIVGMFVAVFWAFGWRVFAVAAVLWGCNGSAPFYWTGGALLRQDWIFYLVLAACLTRKRYFKLAGASMVYAGLLRIFPGLCVIGWLTVAGAYLFRHKRLARDHAQMLIGGLLAAAVLVPTSLAVCGTDSYTQFYKHTLEVHDRTPLTNHMGLRVLISHNVGSDMTSGRMKYTKDTKLTDPFELWMRMRNERYAKYRWVAYAIVALSLLFFIRVVRDVRSMWVAQCLGQIFIVLLSQLTSYYYSFVILMAPLTKPKRFLEAPLFGYVALSQFVWMTFFWNDDKYTVLTLITLIACFALVCVFGRAGAIPMPWKRANEDDASTPAGT